MAKAADYRKSNAHRSLDAKGQELTRLSGLMLAALALGDDPLEREKTGQLLIDALCGLWSLPECTLVVADRRQVHSTTGTRVTSRTYGYYRCRLVARQVEGARIRIYHKTAIREQVTAPATFLNTLLHEWVHHYDFCRLKLTSSPHTSGFYARLSSLRTILMPPCDPVPSGEPEDGMESARRTRLFPAVQPFP